MPTGYTFGVEDGSVTELKDYAMTCARAFGAYARYRDQKDAPDHFEVDKYYYDAVERAQKKYDEYIKSSPDFTMALKMYEGHIKEREENYKKALKKYKESVTRYSDMLKKVHNWKPGKDHEKLKDFMIQQLEYSIDGEYEPELYKDTKEDKKKYIEDLITGKWEELDLKQAKENLQNEINRVNECNKWVEGLKESLK